MNSNDNLSFKTVDWHEVNAVVLAARAERARFLAQTVGGAFRGLGRFVASLFEVISRAAQSARLYDELSRMSDRQLADIGLNREDLSRVVAQSMGKPRAQTKVGNVVELPAKAAADREQVRRAA